MSIIVFVQAADAPEPQASGEAGGQTQTPAEHAWPGEQALLQAPQLFASPCRFAQNAPSPEPQTDSLAGHAVMQTPLTHAWPALQAVAQAPQ